MTNQELDLIETNDLVNALKRRFGEIVIVARHRVDAETSNLLATGSGDFFVQVALAKIATKMADNNLKHFLNTARRARE